MRTTSIISIIRKYGLNSKRLNPKNRIKYTDAIKALKGFENADLAIQDVIDNQRFPQHSHSTHCQVPGCGMHIRYEYILKNKGDSSELVAGSTCVWALLGLSELEIKQFKGLENAIKEYHMLEDWKALNPDVVDKLNQMKTEGINRFRPFWMEIEFSRLTDEDTDYIRKVDLSALINPKPVVANPTVAEVVNQVTKNSPKVIQSLEILSDRYPNNLFYKSLKQQVERGKTLSYKQERAIKVSANKMWYYSKIKGTSQDCWSTCEDIVIPLVNEMIVKLENKYTVEYYLNHLTALVSHYFKNNLSADELQAWNVFKVKNTLVD